MGSSKVKISGGFLFGNVKFVSEQSTCVISYHAAGHKVTVLNVFPADTTVLLIK